ncbi:MAG: hypothetical protein R3C14_34515 [Caldilineaceae bacterium]
MVREVVGLVKKCETLALTDEGWNGWYRSLGQCRTHHPQQQFLWTVELCRLQ